MNRLAGNGAAVIFGDPQWNVTLTGGHAATGRTAVWLMNGLSAKSSTYLTDNGTLEPKSIADFDGDGKADIVWRSGAGATQLTLMNGLIPATTTTLSTTASMSVAKVGDFDGHGMADLLWLDTSTGQSSIWLMNGTTKANSAILPADTRWSVSPIKPGSKCDLAAQIIGGRTIVSVGGRGKCSCTRLRQPRRYDGVRTRSTRPRANGP